MNIYIQHIKSISYNIETQEIFTSTRFEFYNHFNLRKSGVCEMINKGVIFKNWKVIS